MPAVTYADSSGEPVRAWSKSLLARAMASGGRVEAETPVVLLFVWEGACIGSICGVDED